jgi:hypothetical protein
VLDQRKAVGVFAFRCARAKAISVPQIRVSEIVSRKRHHAGHRIAPAYGARSAKNIGIDGADLTQRSLSKAITFGFGIVAKSNAKRS